MRLLELVAIILPIPTAWFVTWHFELHGLQNGLCWLSALALEVLFIWFFSRNTQVSETD